MNADLFYRFGIAIVIGLLVGLQREHASLKDPEPDTARELFAGARTFAVLGLLGSLGAFVADLLQAPLIFAVLLLLVGVLITVAYGFAARRGSAGLTTEVAALVTLLTGGLCYWNQVALAAAVAVALVLLLAVKLQMQSLARRITPADVYATLKFAVITVIVLPLLPREGYGPPPFDVLVPSQIWLMVVFISGISFLGYGLVKLIDPRRGVGLTGLLGGLVSSTAVTLSFAQQSRAVDLPKPFALAILGAWTVMFLRILVEVAALNRALLGVVWMPMTLTAAVSGAYCLYLYRTQDQQPEEAAHRFTNPFKLGPVLTFGALYAVILLLANAAQQYLGNTGVYLAGIVSGMADVDAITLSMAELSRPQGDLALRTAARVVVLAAASNTLIKGIVVLLTGSPALRRVLLPGLLLTVATAVGVVLIV